LFKDIFLKAQNPRDLTTEEIKEALDELEHRHVVQNKRLYHRCSVRACRRLRDCTAEERCICAGPARLGRRIRQRLMGMRSRRYAMRF